jgi:hypothetical protein
MYYMEEMTPDTPRYPPLCRMPLETTEEIGLYNIFSV